MIRGKIVVFVALLVCLSLIPAVTGSESSYDFDGAPLSIALAQALNSLISSDYQSAIMIASQAVNASVPSGMAYTHKKTWMLILDFSTLMLQAKKNSTIGDAMIYKLYRDVIELKEILPQYRNDLLIHIYDSSLKYQISKMLEIYTEKLTRAAEVRISEVAQITMNSLSINVTVPQNVYAGSIMPVTVSLPEGFTVSKIRVIILLTIPILDQLFYINTSRTTVHIDVRVPGAESYAYNYKRNPGKVFVIASGVYNGSTLELFTSKPVNIQAERPRMYFDIPNSVPVNHTLELTVISESSIPLIANISIVKPGNTTPIVWERNSIYPGRTHLILHTENLDPGLYTLRIHILPKEMYVEALYSKAILIEEPEIKTAAPTIIIGPPFVAIVRLELGDFNSSGIILVKGAYSASNGSEVDPGHTYVEVSLGWTTLASSKNVTFEFIGGNGKLRASRTVRMTSINIISVVALTTIFSVLSSISARGLRIRLERLSLAISRAAKMAGGKTGGTAAAIYKSFLSKIRDYGLPGESETLREYLNRLTVRLHGTRDEGAISYLRAFILAYEKYLYSKHKPGIAFLRRLYKELVRRLR